MRGESGKTVAAVLGLFLISTIVALLIQLMPEGRAYLKGQANTPNDLTRNQTETSGKPPSSNVTPLTVDEIISALTDKRERTQKESYGEQFFKNLSTDPIVWLTLALTFLAFVQLKVYFAEVRDTRAIERAYVTLKHNRPGLHIGDPEKGECYVSFGVKNMGHTPTTVTAVHVERVIVDDGEKLPTIPTYSRLTDELGKGTHAFLVHEGEFNLPLIFTTADLPAVISGAKTLFVIGYVDYIDQFGTRHRAGYGRQYRPDVDVRANHTSGESFSVRNNLVFIPQANYSYDRMRRKGEGDDWNEKA